MKQVLIVLVALCSAACGSDSSPTAPAPVIASVAGSWSGTAQYTAGGNPGVQAVVMNLTQAGSSVNGTYAAQTFDGTVTGATSATSFSGTFTFNGKTTVGAACTGTFAVSGIAGGSTVTWTSPAITATCPNTPLNVVLALQRR